MAQIGLGIVERYLNNPATTTRFQIAQGLLDNAAANRTIEAHYCRGFQLLINASLGHLDDIQASITVLMNDHWPVWDRIDRRTILFALDLLGQHTIQAQ